MKSLTGSPEHTFITETVYESESFFLSRHWHSRACRRWRSRSCSAEPGPQRPWRRGDSISETRIGRRRVRPERSRVHRSLHWSGQGRGHLIADCMKSVEELVAACNALGVLTISNSKNLRDFARAVEPICQTCETECRKHERHAPCKACAESCAACIHAIRATFT